MKRHILFSLILLWQINIHGQAKQDKPLNVIMIAIDDINDWIAPLGGHPQALTPHMDKFCDEGAMVFKNAVCAAPICGPSRSALLSGYMPNRTGVYGNATNMIYTDLVKENATLPEYFSKHGYHTMANGKIFHKHASEHGVDFGHWAFDEFERSRRYVKDGPQPSTVTSAKQGSIKGEKRDEYKNKNCKLSWGPTKANFEKTVDGRVANWAIDQMGREYDKPFFMSVGFIKPHLPWFVPQPFFDMYSLDSLQVPLVLEDDLKDILNPDGSQLHHATSEYKWIKEHGLEKEATRAYLANISFIDRCFGMVIEALENSPYADNTMVIVWGDHGWHLGEKQRYLKNTLWSETAKTPLMVRMPGMDKFQYCSRTISLIDIYPTLVSLCNFPAKDLDGHDFSGLLTKPKSKWSYPGVTVSATGTSVMGERYHYISNLSGAEELYDLQNDPMEFTNLANKPEYKKEIKEMKKWVPKERAIAPRIHFKKPPNYVDADADPSIKKQRDLKQLK